MSRIKGQDQMAKTQSQAAEREQQMQESIDYVNSGLFMQAIMAGHAEDEPPMTEAELKESAEFFRMFSSLKKSADAETEQADGQQKCP